MIPARSGSTACFRFIALRTQVAIDRFVLLANRSYRFEPANPASCLRAEFSALVAEIARQVAIICISSHDLHLRKTSVKYPEFSGFLALGETGLRSPTEPKVAGSNPARCIQGKDLGRIPEKQLRASPDRQINSISSVFAPVHPEPVLWRPSLNCVIVAAIVRDKNPIAHYPGCEKIGLLRSIEAASEAKSANQIATHKRVIAFPNDRAAAVIPHSTFLTFPTPRAGV